MNNRILVLFILFVSISSFTCSGSNANRYIDKNLKSKECFSNLLSTPESFQLFSHGRAGELLIDGEWLTAPQISIWLQKNKLLKGITHLNIYACEFGQGVKGQNAVAYLEKSLNITLAASDDITGANGDWDLEVGTRKDVLKCPAYPYSLQNEFITTWEVSAGDLDISIPTNKKSYAYNYTVDWGDGMLNSTNQTGDAMHTYATAGVYTVKISGTFPAIFFNGEGDKDKIKIIEQWGDIEWHSMSSSFYGCANLRIKDGIAPPDLSKVTSMEFMFSNAISLDADLGAWDVSNVVYMGNAFEGTSSFFGKGLDKWDVRNVESVSVMFGRASNFDVDLSSWDVSNVQDMNGMFWDATSFTGRGLDKWDIINVTTMGSFLKNISLPPATYTSILNAWAKLPVKNNVYFFAGNSWCCDDSGRKILDDKYGWSISDYGQDPYAPVIDLGKNQANCKGNTITLDAENSGATYLWNTGETSQTISVNTLGTFSVKVTSARGCVESDTIKITNELAIDLGKDKDICEGGASVNLTVVPDAAWGTNPYYEWSTSVTGVTIPAPAYGQTVLITDKTGDYTLTVIDQNGCSGSDEIHVEEHSNPVVTIEISDKSSPMCLGTTFEFDAGNSGATYVWGGKATGETSQKITHILKDPAGANFDVEVTNEFGCIASDNIHVIAKVDHIVPTITFPALSDDKITAYTDPGRNVSSTVSWGTPDVTDNCHIKSITNNAPVTMEFPVGETKVLWQAEDFSGNIEDHTITVIVVDNESPVAPVSADLNGECSITAVSPTTTDNCSGTITGTTTDPLSYNTQGTHVIHWKFDDGNGNSIIVLQNVILDDVTAPVIPNLPDITGECSITAVSPTTTDNCSGTITGTTTDPLTYNTEGSYVINWTFDDGNGNSIIVPQNVIVDDVTAPAIPGLPDLTGECSVTAVSLTITDNCSGTITGTTTDLLSYNTQGTHVIHWTFDDGNGNSIIVLQNVIVDDVTAPAIPSLPDLTEECSITAVSPTTTDNCSGTIPSTTTDPLSYTTQGIHVIHWTFDDGNGNIISVPQNVILDDVTAPAIPSLPDLTGECSITAVSPTTTDNCSGTITGTTTDPLSYNTQGTHVIHWTFDDGNGNSIIVLQNVILDDVTAPVIPNLPDITEECSITAVSPTTTDNCSGTIAGTTADPLSYTTQGIHVIHWTFDDGNGNIISVPQNVILDDVTAPAIPSLPDLTGECSITAVSPTTTDNCSGTITGTTTDPLTYNTEGSYVINWTFDDGNGNSIIVPQNVIVDDVTAPAIPNLPDLTGECSVTAVSLTTTDNCSGTITGTTTDPLSYTMQGTYVIQWIFDDGNGNSITLPQNVIVDDVIAPVIPNLPDLTEECSITAVSPTTIDNCSGTITGTTTDPLSYTTQGIHVINWTFDDGNGNSITLPQNVIVDDVIAPVIPNLPDLTEECSITAVSPTTIDNCSGTITGTTTDPLSYTTQGIHVINWTFDDGNGNSITVPQNVILNDLTAPIAPVLDDVSGMCIISLAVPTASDNCAGEIQGTTLDPLTYNTEGSYVINWTFDDGNGNISNTAQNVDVFTIVEEVELNSSATELTCDVKNIDLTARAKVQGEAHYKWFKDNDLIPGETASVLEIENGDEGEYSVEVSDKNLQCNVLSDPVLITEDIVVPIVSLSPLSGSLSSAESIIIRATVLTKGEAAYVWSTGEITSSIEVKYPGEYSVEVTDNANGCSVNSSDIGQEAIIMNYWEENLLRAFTPNADGYNDSWRIERVELVQKLKIAIYNRWGKAIYKFSGSGNEYKGTPWKGTDGNGDLPIGSYYYVIKIDDEKPMKGTVTILR
ncbi:MAG: BspA family leucine-rich repeat surface protein [Labilibaculum antarcticum]